MGWPKGKPTWNAGLTKSTSNEVLASAKKTAITMKGKSFITDEGRKALSAAVSENMKARYAAGWVQGGGRCKKIAHNSPSAGLVFLDGTWEEKVAQHLDELCVEWNRNKKRFPYARPDGKASTYCPDFYVKDWDCFIEVKGYETEIDRCKWKDFPFRLEVWKHEKIQTLGR